MARYSPATPEDNGVGHLAFDGPSSDSDLAKLARGPRTLADYVEILKRRRAVLILTVVVVTVLSIALSLTRSTLYSATAQVLLSRQNIANSITNTPDTSNVTNDAERLAQTQAVVARSPNVAARALRRTRIAMSPTHLLDNSTVTASPDADILSFTVKDGNAARARRLATRYAAAFTGYRRQLDTTALQRALSEVDSKLRSLGGKSGVDQSALVRSLSANQQRLRTLEALQTSNAFLVKPASSADKVRPTPVRAGVIGLFAGILLGLIAAFVREALDTRIRRSDEIEQRLGLPLLAALPAPPRELRRSDEVSMLAEPDGPSAESFRVLRTNLDFSMIRSDVQTIMVTSAIEAEGKSTTVVNLAVALAREGRSVTLVDLDLRRPAVSRFLHLEDRAPGVTEVVLGRTTLDDALIDVQIPAATEAASEWSAGDGHGVLRVLPAGIRPPDVGEFVGSSELAAVIAEVAKRGDLILIDAPPALRVSDALTLSRLVDGVVVVARLRIVQRRMLDDLKRLLSAMPARKLGFCLAGAESEPGAYYAGYSGYYYSSDDSASNGDGGGRRLGRRRKSAQAS